MFLEYHELGSLAKVIKMNIEDKQLKFNEESAKKICAQLLLSVDYMNHNNIIHRDLKPENILVKREVGDSYEVKVADFGLSIMLKDKSEKDDHLKICGTPGFIAPESLKNQGYNHKSDMFSIGAILYYIMSGLRLFKGNQLALILEQNKMCNRSFVQSKIESFSKDA